MFPLALLAIVCISTTESISIEKRIIGGQSSEITKAPYLVSIRYKKNISASFEHRCSGTIYSSKLILTTATCLIGLDSKRLNIKAGSTYRTRTDGYLYLVEKYKIHPEYNIWLRDNDLALLLLSFDLEGNISKEIAPITLIRYVPQVGSWAFIAGWGQTDSIENYSFSEVLQATSVEIADQSDCKRSYGENRLSQAMLCATGNDTDACLGDAGGALVYEGKALGLISWGYGCSNLIMPSIYTNLVYFNDWIENEVNSL